MDRHAPELYSEGSEEEADARCERCLLPPRECFLDPLLPDVRIRDEQQPYARERDSDHLEGPHGAR
jgi:hypothetical protein